MSKPVNLTPPVITGNFAPGGTITASAGTWSGDPTTFGYRRRRARPHEFLSTSFWAAGQAQPWEKNLGRYIAEGPSLTMATPFAVAYEEPADTARIQSAIAAWADSPYPYDPYFGERYALPFGLGISAPDGGGYTVVGVVCEVTATNEAGSARTTSKIVREHGVPKPWGPGPNTAGTLGVASARVITATPSSSTSTTSSTLSRCRR